MLAAVVGSTNIPTYAGQNQNIDNTPPSIVIESVKTYALGDAISYRKGLVVADNIDAPEDIIITIDSSQVNNKKVGDYAVAYYATDKAGNVSSAVGLICIRDETSDEIKTKQYVDGEVKKIITKIIKQNMTDKEKAKAIFDYVKSSVRWDGSATDRELYPAAYRALKKKNGDCYTYYAITKLLLDEAKIKNIMVTRDTEREHYWSLVDVGDGWYHYDTTPTTGANVFLYTDAEVQAYAESRKDGRSDYYKFDKEKYKDYPRGTVTYK